MNIKSDVAITIVFLSLSSEKVLRGNFTIPGIQKLLFTVRFYAVGSFLQPLADAFGISKSSACDIVGEVSFLISSKLAARYIRVPTTDEELVDAKSLFYRIAWHPLVIGAIDCTHIKTRSFGGENAELYRNRKRYFSLNVQLVVSANVCIHILTTNSSKSY